MKHRTTDPALRAEHIGLMVAEKIYTTTRACVSFTGAFLEIYPTLLQEMHAGLAETSRLLVRRRNKEFRRFWKYN